MKKSKNHVGIDISKSSFDAAINLKGFVCCTHFLNSNLNGLS